MRPFSIRLTPSRSPTNVPTRASCECKRFASLSFTAWGQTHDSGGNTSPGPKHFPLPKIYVADPYTFLCTPAYFVRWDTNTSFSHSRRLMTEIEDLTTRLTSLPQLLQRQLFPSGYRTRWS